MSVDKLNLRPPLKKLVAVFLEEPPADVDALLKEVHEHAEAAKAASRFSPVHIPIARTLGDGLETLLKSISDQTPDEHRRLIQAAGRYFVDSEDESPDMESPFGFHDDAEVFNAVAIAVGRQDLAFDF